MNGKSTTGRNASGTRPYSAEREAEFDDDLEGLPITPFIQDVYDAIDVDDVIRSHACDEREHLPVPVAEMLLQNVTDAPARRKPKRLADDDRLTGTDPIYGWQVLIDEYRDWFPNIESAHELVTELTVEEWRRELLAGAHESDANHDPDDVRIGTIHAAKGLKAPCVLVFPAYTHRQLERFQDGAEAEERRLYYVALTRASEATFVVHDYFAGSEFSPLARDGALLRTGAPV